MSEAQEIIFSNNEQPCDPLIFTDTATAVLHTPCTALLLNKENALYKSAALVESFMLQMSLINLLGKYQL